METRTTETTQEVRNKQSIVPEWMDTILTQADAQGKNVVVTRTVAPFGSYVTALEITDDIIMVIPEVTDQPADPNTCPYCNGTGKGKMNAVEVGCVMCSSTGKINPHETPKPAELPRVHKLVSKKALRKIEKMRRLLIEARETWQGFGDEVDGLEDDKQELIKRWYEQTGRDNISLAATLHHLSVTLGEISR